MQKLTRQQILSLTKEPDAKNLLLAKWQESLTCLKESQFAYRELELAIHFLPATVKDNEFSLPNLKLFLRRCQTNTAQREVDKWQRLLYLNDPPPLTKNYINVEEVRRIPIESLHAFEKVQRYGARTKALCPFHAEVTPSFVIYHDNNSWYCFGGCATGSDNIAFVRRLHDFDFKEACAFILKA